MIEPVLTRAREGLPASDFSDAELPLVVIALNDAYRSGRPIVSDHRYDHEFIPELRRRFPDHPILGRVEAEPEGVFGDRKVRHPQPMLSTEKAYGRDEVERFLVRLLDGARAIGLSPSELDLRATVKLDGIAGRYDGSVLCTRGDGITGNDITRCLRRGVRFIGSGSGHGEIVVSKSYFEENLSDYFENERNFIFGAVSADDLSPVSMEALDVGAAQFVMYSSLPSWTGTPEEFLERMESIVQELKQSSSDYAQDGIILETMNPALRDHLGATSHHWRSMLAIKERGETGSTTVESVTWQTGRTGRVTPVLNVKPIRLSGATISNVTAHHAGMLRDLGIGIGASIELIRSGEVIPKIERVLERGTVTLASHCPDCGTALVWENGEEDKFLCCPNTAGCSAQIENSLRHFFATLGAVDLFGPATIEKLNQAGVRTLQGIYQLGEEDFRRIGFGPGQSANLVRELKRSREEAIEDWRFLAAFGIRHLGRGDSRRLLLAIPLRELGLVTATSIRAIHGFGEVTSESIARELAHRWNEIDALLALGFNLTSSRKPAAEGTAAALAGKRIVFTGTMTSGDREDMENQAARLGAQVQSSVNGKTDYLVIGEKPGNSKLSKAEKLGTRVLTEAEYLALLG